MFKSGIPKRLAAMKEKKANCCKGKKPSENIAAKPVTVEEMPINDATFLIEKEPINDATFLIEKEPINDVTFVIKNETARKEQNDAKIAPDTFVIKTSQDELNVISKFITRYCIHQSLLIVLL